MNFVQPIPAGSATVADPQAEISARLERLPVTREVFWARNIVGAATFLRRLYGNRDRLCHASACA